MDKALGQDSPADFWVPPPKKNSAKAFPGLGSWVLVSPYGGTGDGGREGGSFCRIATLAFPGQVTLKSRIDSETSLING